MKLFGNGRAKQGKTAPSAPGASGAADEALDTLGSIVNTLGRHAFDLEEEPAQVFAEKCERWSRHVLTGWTGIDGDKATPAVGESDPGSSYAAVRRWAELRSFVTQRRRAEQKFVDGKLDEFRGVVWDLVAGLRSLVGGDNQTEKQIDDGLVKLELAAREQSLERLRGAVTEAVGSIRQAVQEQQRRSRDQLAAMGQRLAGMRRELIDVRRELQLDALTRLYNRGAFDETLRRYVDLALIGGQSLMLMLVDLDHFKRINDTYGHPVGDQALVAAARCIVRTFPRRNDFVARYGGEEFAVILLDVGPREGGKLAERLLGSVRALELDHEGEAIPIRCSIGYAHVEERDDAAALLDRADRALLRAKKMGRDRAEPGAAD